MTTPDDSLPYSEDSEKAILSVLMQLPDMAEDVAAELHDQHFYHPANKLLFQTLMRAHAEGRPCDLVGITTFTMDLGIIDNVGGPGTLADIYSFLPTYAHYPYYRDILIQKEKVRAFLIRLDEAKKEALEIGHEDPSALIQKTQDGMGEILKADPTKKDETFKEQLRSYVDVLEARILGHAETGIPTRWDRWNAVFGGITPTMWTISAFPGCGKTALAQNLAEDVLAHDAEVIWFSYEMSKTETIDRLVCAKARIPSQKIFFPKNNPMDNREAAHVMASIKGMLGHNLHLRCDPTLTIEQIVTEVRRMKRKRPNLKLAIIDYLQLIPTKKEFKQRSEQVAYISRTAKRDIQAANEICCVMLSQLNDEGKTLDSRAPIQDSSCIVRIEPEFSETVKNREVIHPAGIRVGKNRNLPSGELLKMRLNGQFFTFEEYAPDVVKQ